MVDFPPQRECCAVSSGITTTPSTRESEFSKNVCFLNSVSLFENVPVALFVCLCCRQLNETENQQDTANIYRNMSWEVHIKSLGISFYKSGLEERGKESDGGEGGGGCGSREGETGDNSHDLKQRYKTERQI